MRGGGQRRVQFVGMFGVEPLLPLAWRAVQVCRRSPMTRLPVVELESFALEDADDVFNHAFSPRSASAGRLGWLFVASSAAASSMGVPPGQCLGPVSPNVADAAGPREVSEHVLTRPSQTRLRAWLSFTDAATAPLRMLRADILSHEPGPAPPSARAAGSLHRATCIAARAPRAQSSLHARSLSASIPRVPGQEDCHPPYASAQHSVDQSLAWAHPHAVHLTFAVLAPWPAATVLARRYLIVQRPRARAAPPVGGARRVAMLRSESGCTAQQHRHYTDTSSDR
ncbi:hypothetical protein HYPSUDRAFT_220895 [Hypholoma sublateritium FD-334 SS-4]|uniref:Uncharacterized protein n=1 Tax=Hypholoma sublateritium (strain FD-334 SS-4) TaxID=945553 RepID=A0A0D2N9N7_HYPSF|nr:hypothetical protein HYPSUDRAFT_220895 [Hypholoma sublateritium FD-334 SS-4]